jgi:hypothetical protein
MKRRTFAVGSTIMEREYVRELQISNPTVAGASLLA